MTSVSAAQTIVEQHMVLTARCTGSSFRVSSLSPSFALRCAPGQERHGRAKVRCRVSAKLYPRPKRSRPAGAEPRTSSRHGREHRRGAPVPRGELRFAAVLLKCALSQNVPLYLKNPPDSFDIHLRRCCAIRPHCALVMRLRRRPSRNGHAIRVVCRVSGLGAPTQRSRNICNTCKSECAPHRRASPDVRLKAQFERNCVLRLHRGPLVWRPAPRLDGATSPGIGGACVPADPSRALAGSR